MRILELLVSSAQYALVHLAYLQELDGVAEDFLERDAKGIVGGSLLRSTEVQSCLEGAQ